MVLMKKAQYKINEFKKNTFISYAQQSPIPQNSKDRCWVQIWNDIYACTMSNSINLFHLIIQFICIQIHDDKIVSNLADRLSHKDLFRLNTAQYCYWLQPWTTRSWPNWRKFITMWTKSCVRPKKMWIAILEHRFGDRCVNFVNVHSVC